MNFAAHVDLLNSKQIHQITNHPVHLIGEDGKLSSPSALIPFCWFGVNMSNVGVKIDQFDVPVCNSFRAKVLDDQLCYEVDPNRLRKNVSINDFNEGFKFYVDLNEDRQYPTLKSPRNDFLMYLDTVGRYLFEIIVTQDVHLGK